jgi:hypothetical protein
MVVKMADEKEKATPALKHTRKEIRALRGDVRNLLKFGTEFEAMQFLRRIGIKDEDPRFGPLVKYYRDLKSGKL